MDEAEFTRGQFGLDEDPAQSSTLGSTDAGYAGGSITRHECRAQESACGGPAGRERP
jgi:hypothetical protein